VAALATSSRVTPAVVDSEREEVHPVCTVAGHDDSSAGERATPRFRNPGLGPVRRQPPHHLRGKLRENRLADGPQASKRGERDAGTATAGDDSDVSNAGSAWRRSIAASVPVVQLAPPEVRSMELWESVV
jgi:hypothetical protein